ncbi:homeobox expressed in ES cells 1 isoform 1-T6 [Anomaloglossus baeobatrachus]|uniref:homeobox expressed in ES cells 1 n=1 Tax=Anomaloglossus baeobatrachus TaxID=238106 RepID=UPI003F4FD970
MKTKIVTTVYVYERSPRMAAELQKGSCPADNKPTSCSFSIESILGLDKKRDLTSSSIRHYRPWMDTYCRREVGSHCWRLPIISYEIPLQAHPAQNTEKDEDVNCETCCPTRDRVTYKRELSWYRGRRPRTAFTRSQIEVLENVFHVNSYPGIDVREELAIKLSLDEDRIQIWFQNRRAKLKRCHRESQFLIVKESLNPQIQE